MTNSEEVLNVLSGGEELTIKEMIAKTGCRPQHVSGAAGSLLQKGKIERIGEDRFRLAKKPAISSAV